MTSVIIIVFFAFVFVFLTWALINLTQKKKKLLPEYINGKPTVAFFWTDEHKCREMEKFVNELKENFKGSVKVLNFNVLKDYQIAENYLILNVPTVILFDREGNQILKITETKDFAKLESKLKEII
ncbi:Thioredoxin [Candidatus Chrysopegis kryptomonas]|uniref:Thioredoxin n=1 Tax=Candidatus Chryseopegocella kryptomonas TaxID=1633643 RepID=A0A0P1NT76_9BACT|nr:Thioredoxin [Candidatus Chrysopegis kryptomonas]